ncbi:hypothetical protein [Candidatus Uabimicrobium sp. HlEnr_7]|uniref:hypothetical protein n=1 Tax=Candidatus Uabimicrobium helgolandensis TaxID=3095367 RepID=UPI0035576BCF
MFTKNTFLIVLMCIGSCYCYGDSQTKVEEQAYKDVEQGIYKIKVMGFSPKTIERTRDYINKKYGLKFELVKSSLWKFNKENYGLDEAQKEELSRGMNIDGLPACYNDVSINEIVKRTRVNNYLISADDFRYTKDLLSMFNDPSIPWVQHLKKSFSPDFIKHIEENKHNKIETLNNLAEELNILIKHKHLYDPQFHKDISNAKCKKLIKNQSKLTPQEVIKLNRLLLQDAFGNCLIDVHYKNIIEACEFLGKAQAQKDFSAGLWWGEEMGVSSSWPQNRHYRNILWEKYKIRVRIIGSLSSDVKDWVSRSYIFSMQKALIDHYKTDIFEKSRKEAWKLWEKSGYSNDIDSSGGLFFGY